MQFGSSVEALKDRIKIASISDIGETEDSQRKVFFMFALLVRYLFLSSMVRLG